MTKENIFNILKTVCKDVVYTGNECDIKGPPYITWGSPKNDDFFADNSHYARIAEGWIEIYTRKADFALEKKLINALEHNKIPYAKEYEMYLEDEKMFLCRYGIEYLESED